MIAFENHSHDVINMLIPEHVGKRGTAGKTALMFCAEKNLVDGVKMMV